MTEQPAGLQQRVADAIEPHAIAESRHRILNAFTDQKLLLLAQVAGVGRATNVLDLACGKGELLCRWAQEYGSIGHGVDLWQPFVNAARARADELGVSAAVSFEQGDAGEYRAAPASYDLACCMGATWIGGGVGGTIALLRPALRPGGLIIIGEPYWIDPPPDEAYDALGFGPDEFASLPGLLDRFEAAGAELIELVMADPSCWDRYVGAQWATLRAWLDAHPSHPRHEQLSARLVTERRGYLTYQRRYLGWGAFVLRAD
ncbi:MAG: class I SAM-dependent methyltransferase [Jatrophihabitantaceae bacterium]